MVGMRLYHPTRHAESIMRDGFGEWTGTYLTESDNSGVWVFDRPVDRRTGGGDEAVMLVLEVPEAVVLPFETPSHSSYRQFLMPAALLNLYGPPEISDE
jgi:hypothetical protein